MFSSELERVLRDAGWYPGRKVSVAEWVADLTSYGFIVVPEAKTILEEFGGLKVCPIKTVTDAYASEPVIIDSCSDADSEELMEWGQKLQTTLTPIGEYGGQAAVLVAEDRSIYLSWSHILWKCGSSFVDALENEFVFARRKPVEVKR
jgi:SUKH-3 immunity protein of toxin-antitoxin system